jgi:hypothetical protein
VVWFEYIAHKTARRGRNDKDYSYVAAKACLPATHRPPRRASGGQAATHKAKTDSCLLAATAGWRQAGRNPQGKVTAGSRGVAAAEPNRLRRQEWQWREKATTSRG